MVQIGGWIKLWRKIMSHKFYPTNENRKFTRYEAWLDMILLANYEGKKWLGISVERGQLAFAVPFYVSRWKWSDRAVRRFFGALVLSGEVSKQPQVNTVLITICNYEELNPTATTTPVRATAGEVTEDCQPTKVIKNKEEKDSGKKKSKDLPFYAVDSDESQLTNFCIEQIKRNHPTVKFDHKKKQQISHMFNDMVRLDDISLKQAKFIILWVTSHNDLKSGFSWADQFMSPLKFRKSNKDGIRFTTMWLRQMGKEKTQSGGKPADMTAVEWDRVRDMPACEKCETKEHMKIMSRSGRMSKWYCQKCNTANTVQR